MLLEGMRQPQMSRWRSVQRGLMESAMDRWSRLRIRLFTRLIAGQFQQFGAGSRIEPPFRHRNLGEISVEEDVMIHRDCWIQAVSSQDKGLSPKLILKRGAGIGMGATISAAQSVLIGEYALLARNVYISDHGHAFENVKEPIMYQGITEPRPVSIGRHSWLGQNACVFPGVTIGQHCVIGANSVVNSSIPDFSVAVGAPARVVRKYNQDSGRWEAAKTESSSGLSA